MTDAMITVAVPSYNQGRFLSEALESIIAQDVPVEIMVADGGSSDDSVAVIKRCEKHISWWRSSPDGGQSAAINEAIAKGTAPYVCWLNADDLLLPRGLKALLAALEAAPDAPAAYGKSWEVAEDGTRIKPYWTAPFSRRHLANRCMISQPATLIRRSAWEAIGGVDESLDMVMDYDLWWRLSNLGHDLVYWPDYTACTRIYNDTKTSSRRDDHYREAMLAVKRHYGRVPLKWYVAWPYAVWFRSLVYRFRRCFRFTAL